MSVTQLKTSVTVKAADLVRVLNDVLPFASRDVLLPMINGVCLEAVAGTMSATATDRYTLGHARTECGGGFKGQHVIRLADAVMLTKLFKPSRATGNPTIRITVDAAVVLRFAHDEDEALGGAPALGVGIRPALVEFPKYVKIVGDSTRARKPAGVDHAIGLDPSYLARFAKVSRDFSAPARFYTYGATKPIVVEIGDTFTGMMMPVRFPDSMSGHAVPVVPIGHQSEPAQPAQEAA